MNTPFFTIITPCYNVEKYLNECVESIMRQSFNDWELILVDDGSTDFTPAICDRWAAKDNRIKVIHKQNGGVSSARNVALEKAKGEWITFIDSDDWFEDNAFDTFCKAIEDCDCERYIFNRYSVNEGVRLPISHLRPSKLIRKGEELKWFMLDMLYPYYDNIINKVITGGIRGVNCSLYKHDVIISNNIRFNTELKIAEDALFNYDVISHAETVMMSDIFVGNYRINSDSVMHRYTPDILDANNLTIKAFYDKVSDKIVADVDYKRAFVGMIAECIFRSMKLFLLHPNNKKSIKERIEELKAWVNIPIIKEAIEKAELDYLPKGKKQIIWSIKNNNYALGMIFGHLAILYLKAKRQF